MTTISTTDKEISFLLERLLNSRVDPDWEVWVGFPGAVLLDLRCGGRSQREQDVPGGGENMEVKKLRRYLMLEVMRGTGRCGWGVGRAGTLCTEHSAVVLTTDGTE